jgi:hypothetical protein
MCEEAKRSLLFVKSLRRVTFGGLVGNAFEEWARVEAQLTPAPELAAFVDAVACVSDISQASRMVDCTLRCDVSLRIFSDRLRATSGSASFLVTHQAGFRHNGLRSLAERLKRNDERAVPWVSIAVPLDAKSFEWEGRANARWRVFLPLLEEGPCGCVLNAAVFVDPSRRAVEFRTEGSDETQRKSEWNRTLVEDALVPLLTEMSAKVIEAAPQLVELEPKRYLSLFPTAGDDEPAKSLADVVRASFGRSLWLLKLYDVWQEPFEVGMGPDAPGLTIEKVPEWLLRYKSPVRDLTTESRRFVAWNVGDALEERLEASEKVRVTRVAADVADCILRSDSEPRSADLERLLKLLPTDALSPSDLEDRWALQRAGSPSVLLRFQSQILYFVRTDDAPPVYDALAAIGIAFDHTEW